MKNTFEPWSLAYTILQELQNTPIFNFLHLIDRLQNAWLRCLGMPQSTVIFLYHFYAVECVYTIGR